MQALEGAMAKQAAQAEQLVHHEQQGAKAASKAALPQADAAAAAAAPAAAQVAAVTQPLPANSRRVQQAGQPSVAAAPATATATAAPPLRAVPGAGTAGQPNTACQAEPVLATATQPEQVTSRAAGLAGQPPAQQARMGNKMQQVPAPKISALPASSTPALQPRATNLCSASTPPEGTPFASGSAQVWNKGGKLQEERFLKLGQGCAVHAQDSP